MNKADSRSKVSAAHPSGWSRRHQPTSRIPSLRQQSALSAQTSAERLPLVLIFASGPRTGKMLLAAIAREMHSGSKISGEASDV